MDVPPGLEKDYIGLLYETGIIILFLLLLVFIIIHYIRKKTLNTFLLLASFTCMLLAIVFSWLSKLLLVNEITPDFDELDSNLPGFWIFGLILSFRISFVVIVIAADITHILKVKIFDDTPNKVERWILVIFSLFTIVFALTAMEKENVTLDVLAFLFVLIVMCFVYIPFVIASLKMYRVMKEPHYKRASLSLAILGISFIMVFVGFLADRIVILIRGYGYSVFYFAAWGFVILGTFAAYMGYIRTSRQKTLKEKKISE